MLFSASWNSHLTSLWVRLSLTKHSFFAASVHKLHVLMHGPKITSFLLLDCENFHLTQPKIFKRTTQFDVSNAVTLATTEYFTVAQTAKVVCAIWFTKWTNWLSMLKYAQCIKSRKHYYEYCWKGIESIATHMFAFPYGKHTFFALKCRNSKANETPHNTIWFRNQHLHPANKNVFHVHSIRLHDVHTHIVYIIRYLMAFIFIDIYDSALILTVFSFAIWFTFNRKCDWGVGPMKSINELLLWFLWCECVWTNDLYFQCYQNEWKSLKRKLVAKTNMNRPIIKN